MHETGGRNSPPGAEYSGQTMTAPRPPSSSSAPTASSTSSPRSTEAERAIDPWALADGQLAAADASGRVLRVLSVGASVRLTDTGASEPEQIRARLAERLREDGELSRLVERAIERFGFRR